MSLQWSDNLRIGVDEIDSQHKNLFEILNRTENLKNDSRAYNEILSSLESYVVDHFTSEENLMLTSRYPDYEKHRTQHVTFMRDFSGIKIQYQMNPAALEMEKKLNYLLSEWWLRHVSETDRAFGDYLKTRKS